MNLNNRGPLLTESYGLAALLGLAELAEELGFDHVWVGDGLLTEPRLDPLAVMGALSQRTSRVRLGTACLRVSLRDPLYLAMAWATLDQLSGGRTILGACGANAADPAVRRELAVQRLDPRDRMGRLEEAVHVLRELWTTGSVTFHGKHFDYEDVGFSSGTEIEPLAPLQRPPPIWIVSNPYLGGADPAIARAAVDRAARRVVRLGDGWLTCCRAGHPEEVGEQVAAIHRAARDAGQDPERYAVAYTVTTILGESAAEAERAAAEFVAAYYPGFGSEVDLTDWGPTGTPDDVAAWIRRFADAGVTRFLFRFGNADPAESLRLFAREVLPAFEAERSRT